MVCMADPSCPDSTGPTIREDCESSCARAGVLSTSSGQIRNHDEPLPSVDLVAFTGSRISTRRASTRIISSPS